MTESLAEKERRLTKEIYDQLVELPPYDEPSGRIAAGIDAYLMASTIIDLEVMGRFNV